MAVYSLAARSTGLVGGGQNTFEIIAPSNVKARLIELTLVQRAASNSAWIMGRTPIASTSDQMDQVAKPWDPAMPDSKVRIVNKWTSGNFSNATIPVAMRRWVLPNVGNFVFTLLFRHLYVTSTSPLLLWTFSGTTDVDLNLVIEQ